jgi:serine/threonine protein kinase
MSNNIILNNRYSYDPNPKNRLGKGAFGFVFRGIDLQTNEEIAIKFLQIDMLQDEYLKKALQRELQIQKLCECKYSTRLIDNFVHENFIYLILELCDGDLENELQRNGPFDVNKLRTVLSQLNQVFYIMYQRKIIHRDIKLANILIKYTNPQKTEFDVKLADFGFSTISQENMAISDVGTPLTSSTEVLYHQPYSNKADLWSIGIITY